MELFKLRYGNGKEAVINAISSLDDKECFDVTIKKKRWKRSISQNSLYWLWLTCIEQETGNSREELHDYFRAKFLGAEEVKVFDETIIRLISTTKQDTLEFKRYLDKIQMFASMELHISLPDPEDKYWSDFYGMYKHLL